MKNREKLILMIKEFYRYLIIGGLAFLVDFFTLIILKEFILPKINSFELYLASTAGFIAGLIFNYIFSRMYVFKDNSEKSKTLVGFIIFTIIGIIGVGLTNLGMYVGVGLLLFNYRLVKVFVAGIVLIWNYTARKIFVFS